MGSGATYYLAVVLAIRSVSIHCIHFVNLQVESGCGTFADYTDKDLCKTGVAASRQRAALVNLLEKCGGLPTAAMMKGGFSEVPD